LNAILPALFLRPTIQIEQSILENEETVQFSGIHGSQEIMDLTPAPEIIPVTGKNNILTYILDKYIPFLFFYRNS
jgi:hypothetical protein